MNISITNPIISQSSKLQKNICNNTCFVEEKSINNKPVVISFTGNHTKHLNQIASISAEYQGIADDLYKLGGVGNITNEAAVTFHDKGGADIRTFIPYYSPDNESGGIKVKTPLFDENGRQKQWSVRQSDGSIKHINAYTFKSVPVDYKLKDDEAFVIHDFVSKDKPWTTKYSEVEPVGIDGKVSSIKEDLSGMEVIPYNIFKIKGTSHDIAGKPTVYLVHTPDTAKFNRAYSPAKESDLLDISYSKTYRSVLDALPKMNREEFGNFNPASYWLHDWHTFSLLPIMAEKSASGEKYFNGLRIHSTIHNAGRDFFQGHYNNPIEFFRLVGSENDLKSLQNHPDYKFVQECEKKIALIDDDGRQKDITKALNQKEINKLYSVFDSVIGDFKDEYGEYNMCKIAIEGARKNPDNMTVGTVSDNYGNEMKTNSEIADGLTKDFASVNSINILNGSSNKGMYLDRIRNFGKCNGFEPLMADNFHPLTDEMKDSKNIVKLIEAKEANKKFVISEVSKATQQGHEALAKLFFNEKQLNDGCSVLGGLSDYQKGDVLFFGWGRPTEQKGFPTSIEAVKKFLMSDAPEEDKLHAKFLFGGGPWNEGEENYEAIKKGIKEIEELDGGKYKGQIIYVNGRISNRLTACADYSLLTSVSEPCGMTPFESYNAGTPVISNRTGGAPDFVFDYESNSDKSTGFLTKHSFLVPAEILGLDENVSAQELTLARREFLGKENAHCIEMAMKIHNTDDYNKMVQNCVELNIGWDNNCMLNGGKSSMERYFEEVWNIDKDFNEIKGKERCNDPMKSLKGLMAIATYSRI